MNINEIGEFGLIERIRRSFSRKSRKAPIGIGDDAAALCVSPGKTLLATNDLLIEGVHFDLATTDCYSLGWKSAAVNLSDLAAMGGTPKFCLIALGIPPGISVEQVLEFYRGAKSLLDRYDTLLVGGDTCASKQGLLISVTALGEARCSAIITRSGARPGDLIYVTGTLGDSGAGLELLRNAECGVRSGKAARRETASRINRLIERHLRPVPRVEWGMKLASSGCASAMIDVSDGLSSDLGHLCYESGVGAEIALEMIPLSRALRIRKGLARNAAEYALSAGEDYELLFTVPPSREKKLQTFTIGAKKIGVITREKSLRLIDAQGAGMPLRATGYDHFSSAGGRKRKTK